jgi:hypothetical protein
MRSSVRYDPLQATATAPLATPVDPPSPAAAAAYRALVATLLADDGLGVKIHGVARDSSVDPLTVT